MEVSLTTSIVNYFESLKSFRWVKTGKFCWLLLFSSTLFLITSDAGVTIAAPQQIAQASPRANISRPTLKVGTKGEWVSELQAALKLLGFYSGAVDGVYGEETAVAVSRFKRAADLNPDGVVDAITWQQLFPREPIITPGNSANKSNFPVPPQTRTNTRVVNSQTQPRPVSPPPRPSTTVPGQIPSVQYTTQGLPILRLGMRNPEVRRLQQRLKQLGFLTGDIDGDFGVVTEAAVKAAQQRYGLEADGVVGGATWEALLRR